MQKTLIYKFTTISILMLALLIPLNMISDIIAERQQYRTEAHRQIEQGWSARQTISGVMIMVPYRERVTREEETLADGVVRKKTTAFTTNKVKYILPDTYNLKGTLTTEERYRGIYTFPVYTANLSIKGSFTLPASLGLELNSENIVLEKPSLILGISDVRGIQRSVQVEIDGKKQALLPGTNSSTFPSGVHTLLAHDNFDAEQQLTFTIDLPVQGMDGISFLPVGKDTNVSLASAWPHPSFSGAVLPKTRSVSEKGFNATWETSFFATNMQEALQTCTGVHNCQAWSTQAFGVDLPNSVDIYLKTERSIKYAILFVGLTFVGFYLFEVLKGVRIHAIQYGLVGFSLALFYLLLISLSEHIAFALAYISATAACVSLLGFYVSYVLHSIRRSIVFSLALTGLYSALYVLMGSEDYALLLGSILIFACTGLVMYTTRQIDWHQVGSLSKQHSLAE